MSLGGESMTLCDKCMIASVNLSKPALVKVTTVKVVADDDWIRPVITTDGNLRQKRLCESAIAAHFLTSQLSKRTMTFIP